VKEATRRRGSVGCVVYGGTDGCTQVASDKIGDVMTHRGFIRAIRYPRSWPAKIEPEEFHLKGTIHGRLATLVKRLGVLALFVGIGLACEVQAGCREVCTSNCDGTIGEEFWNCRRHEIKSCETVCRDSHGAIAYSRQTGAWGYSYDHDSQARASRRALGHCEGRAPDCRIVVTFVEQCGAIAETAQRDVSHGLGKTRKEAEDRSLAACRVATGKACTVAAWVCSK